jgi:catalase-peroxidase
MTTSQDWWPADYGHYGPLFIRMAWHSAGTYRVADGRGGAGGGSSASRRSTAGPTTSTSTRRAACSGRSSRSTAASISWADLMVLAGNVAMETWASRPSASPAAARTTGSPEDVYWGPEADMLGDERYTATAAGEPARRGADGPDLRQPGGPERQSRSAGRGDDIRETFGRMAMNDEETVALIAGGHTFGKTHGAGKPASASAPSPKPRPIEQQGLGWKNSCGTGNAGDTITSGLEGAWTRDADPWTTVLRQPVRLRVGADQEPGRRQAVEAEGRRRRRHVPDAHDPASSHAPMMFTTDLALKFDPAYREISQALPREPGGVRRRLRQGLVQADPPRHGPARALSRPEVPDEVLIWQDPVPAVDHR